MAPDMSRSTWFLSLRPSSVPQSSAEKGASIAIRVFVFIPSPRQLMNRPDAKGYVGAAVAQASPRELTTAAPGVKGLP